MATIKNTLLLYRYHYMKKYIKIILPILLPISAFSTASQAADIDISISGSGSVKSIEANEECQANCNISNSLDINTLVATPSQGATFTGWTGQRCDAGQGVLLTKEFSLLKHVTNGAKTLAKADIDQDGNPDLAYISLLDGEMGILTHLSSSTVNKKVITNSLNYPAALAFYDWDNDGDQDLVVTEYGAALIKLYFNNGLGDFSFERDISIDGYKAYSIAIADINNDSLPDLALSSFNANTGGNLAQLASSIRNEKTGWFINNGNDEFTLAVELSQAGAITLDAHKNVDTGDVELAAAEIQQGEIALYSLSTDLTEFNRTLVASGTSAYGVALGDIDDNGSIDVLSSYYSPSSLSISIRNSDNTFASPSIINGFEEGVTATAIADINNDGYQDIVTGEFNNNRFIYTLSNGYKNCVINSTAKIGVTANFTSQSTSSIPTSSSSEDSSGGGTTFSLLLLLSLALMRKTKL